MLSIRRHLFSLKHTQKKTQAGKMITSWNAQKSVENWREKRREKSLTWTLQDGMKCRSRRRMARFFPWHWCFWQSLTWFPTSMGTTNKSNYFQSLFCSFHCRSSLPILFSSAQEADNVQGMQENGSSLLVVGFPSGTGRLQIQSESIF